MSGLEGYVVKCGQLWVSDYNLNDWVVKMERDLNACVVLSDYGRAKEVAGIIDGEVFALKRRIEEVQE